MASPPTPTLHKNPTIDIELHQPNPTDSSNRSQWLRAAVLGANDGLVSTASLMMGIGAVKTDVKAMILTGFAGLIAGASSMAIGEYVSVYSQLDIEMAEIHKENDIDRKKDGEQKLPNPVQAAAASGLAFAMGAMVPLLAASFIKEYRVRLGVVAAAVTAALVGFGVAASRIGRTPAAVSTARVVVGGWLAMGITFGMTRLIGTSAFG